MKAYLGIDIGTTSIKAAVFDENGNRMGLYRREYSLSHDAATSRIECDPEQYVSLCEDAVARLTAECGRIDAISVDTQGETLILADRDGKALCPAVVWLDNRAVEEAKLVREAFGNKTVYEVTGQPEITASWPATKLLWFRRNEPEIFAKIGKIFLLEDWILYRLTGKFVTEPTVQSSSVYFDIRSRRWWRPMLDFIGIREEQLPALCDSAQRIGEYRGIPVVTGALDQIAGAIGMGAAEEGILSEMTGTIMAITALTDRIPPYDPASIVPCHIHAIPGKYCRLLWSPTAGMALKWFRDTLAEGYTFPELDRLAEKIPAGCDGMTVLPCFSGATMPKYRPDARAVFAGVSLAHTRAHFARALMEAVAFELREDLTYLGTGTISGIRAAGGGAAGDLWPQIKADVTGKILSVPKETETACLGSAMLAAVGIGEISDLSAAAKRMCVTDRVFRPSGVDYSGAYLRFTELENQML